MASETSLQMLDRLDDDVADDDPAADHDEQGGAEGGGHEQGAVPVDAFLDGLGRHADADHGDEIVFVQACCGSVTFRHDLAARIGA